MRDDNEHKENKQSVSEEIMDWLESLVLSVFIVLLVFTFICRQVSVDGPSMKPTLIGSEENTNQIADRLIISHLYEKPKQGDIVVIRCDKLNENIIKRVIAVEGQTVDINFDTGEVKVNGQKLVEPYINEPTTLDEKGFKYPVTVPQGHVFVMGDNRNHSTDSRSEMVGFVDVETILGKAVFRVYPFEKMGSLYK